MVHLAVEPIQLPSLTAKDLIEEFSLNLERYSWKDLFSLLDHEITPIVKVIIRAAILSKERKKPFKLTLERAISRVNQIQHTRRKNFVRRIFKKWGLFSMQEILKQYPDYLESMLPVDLAIKKKKVKEKKHKTRHDFRARQLAKYDIAYHTTDSSSKEFNKICERIASLTYADLKKAPIHLTVTLGREKYLYSFHWNTDEREIKEFHSLANKAGATHEQLRQYRANTLIKF
jgi:isopropylmalate/homocitrate/citramalate synthase